MARTRGCLWLITGLIIALLAGVVAFVTLRQAASRPEVQSQLSGGPEVDVVVAAEAVPVRSTLTAQMVELRKVPVQLVPQGAISDTVDAIGKVTAVDLVPGEAILSTRLIDPNVTTADGRYALILAEDEVLMAFPADDLMSKTGVLKPGDKVDLLFSLEFPSNRKTGAAEGEDELASFNLLQNVSVAAVVVEPAVEGQPAGKPTALLLTISPQDALTLKYVKDAGGVVDIVLRAPGADQEYVVDPVDIDRVIDEYGIPLGVGR